MNSKKFRPNVAAVILHPEKKKVLMFRRIAKTSELGDKKDKKKIKYLWQFPQGGVDPGESEEETLFRELEEEIGTKKVSILAVSPKRVRYHYPRNVKSLLKRRPKWKQYKGQQQRWFLVRLEGGTETINFDHQPAEFDSFKWVSPRKGLKKVVPFKRKAYRKGLRLLGVM